MMLTLFPPWAYYLMLKVKILTFQPCFAGKAWKYRRKTVFSDTGLAGFTKRQTKLKLHQKNLKLQKKWDMTQHRKSNKSETSRIPEHHEMKETVLTILKESIDVKSISIKSNVDLIIKGADMLAECITTGHKILIFGNGGSAADAQHIAAEFVNRFKIERPPLAAIALTTDTSIITSIGNDYDFDEIYYKQIKALGNKDDIAIGISTSGNSKNVIKAINAAKKIGLLTIGMTGRSGKLASCADLVLTVQSDVTARIQETHITMGHILCDIVDRILFPEEF